MRSLIISFIVTLSITEVRSQICLNPAPWSPLQYMVAGIDTADFNNDGVLDVFWPNNGGFDVILSNGWGSYQASVNYSGTVSGFSSSNDFNNDNLADVLVVPANSSVVAVFLGNGGGSFTSTTTYTVPTANSGISGDFNNDGKADLALTHLSMPGNFSLSIHLGNGLGGFTPASSYTIPTSSYNLVKGDFNNDGNIDLSLSNGSLVSVFKGLGTGNFSLTAILNYSYNLIAARDVNADGKCDIIGIIDSPSSISIVKASNNFSFAPPQNFASTNGYIWPSITFGDFNSDSKIDIAVPSIIFLNSGTGTFPAQNSYTIPIGGQGPVNAVIAAKFNNDNKIDLVCGVSNSADLVFLLNCNTVGINENSASTQISIFPNPASDFLNLSYEIDELENVVTKVEILNSIGQTVKYIDLIPSNKRTAIDIRDLAAGVYIMKLKGNQAQILSKKFIISE